MKRLKDLIPCDYDVLISSVEDNSKVKNENYLFCCIKGLTFDGHDFVNEVIENGAVAILSEKDLKVSVPVVKVPNTNKAMIEVLSSFYDHVDQKMKIIGATGTDGKTTVISIVNQLLNKFSKAGYIGTNGIYCDGYKKDAYLTTPIPTELFYSLNKFYENKCKYVTMEVSSERLLTKRIDDLKFDAAIFTNLTKDHINNHKSYDDYRDCKLKLFSMVKPDGFCVINIDDDNSKLFINKSTGKVITYGIDKEADYTAKDIVVGKYELKFTLLYNNKEYLVKSPLSGKYNVYNLLAAIATLHAYNYKIEDIVSNIIDLKPILGRANIINYNDKFKVLIDYAHTANALKNILEYANILSDNKVITVTGSAGGRDTLKRPDMGLAVTKYSDYVIFTTDDPRKEDPNDIIDQMLEKVTTKNYRRIIDRKKAIRKAITMAKPGDVVVIAGRGNDTFMPVNDNLVRCNDYEQVYLNLNEGVNV